MSIKIGDTVVVTQLIDNFEGVAFASQRKKEMQGTVVRQFTTLEDAWYVLPSGKEPTEYVISGLVVGIPYSGNELEKTSHDENINSSHLMEWLNPAEIRQPPKQTYPDVVLKAIEDRARVIKSEYVSKKLEREEGKKRFERYDQEYREIGSRLNALAQFLNNHSPDVHKDWATEFGLDSEHTQ